MSEEEAKAAILAAGGERVSFITADFDHGVKRAIALEYYKGDVRHRNAVRYPEGVVPTKARAVLVGCALEGLAS